MFAFTKRQRAVAEMERRRGQASTYTTPLPREAPDLKAFLSEFYRNIIFQKQDEMRAELQKYPSAGALYQQLVVQEKRVAYEDFWQRYYYRTTSVERVQAELEAQDEQKRQEKRASSSFSNSGTSGFIQGLASNVQSFVGDKLVVSPSPSATNSPVRPDRASMKSSTATTSADSVAVTKAPASTESTSTITPSQSPLRAAPAAKSRLLESPSRPPNAGNNNSTESVREEAQISALGNIPQEHNDGASDSKTPSNLTSNANVGARLQETRGQSASAVEATTITKAVSAAAPAVDTTTAQWESDFATTWKDSSLLEASKAPIDDSDEMSTSQHGEFVVFESTFGFPNSTSSATTDSQETKGKVTSVPALVPANDADTANTESTAVVRADRSSRSTGSIPDAMAASVAPSDAIIGSKSTRSDTATKDSPLSPTRKVPPKQVFDALLPAYLKDNVSQTTIQDDLKPALESVLSPFDEESIDLASSSLPKKDERSSEGDILKKKDDTPEKTVEPAAPPTIDRLFLDLAESLPESTTKESAPDSAATPLQKARDKVATIRDSVMHGKLRISSPTSSFSPSTLSKRPVIDVRGAGTVPQQVNNPSDRNGETAVSGQISAVDSLDIGAKSSTNGVRASGADCSPISNDAGTIGKMAATPATAVVSSSPSHDDGSSVSGATIVNKTSSEKRSFASPGEDAPSVPQRYGGVGDAAVEESSATSNHPWSTPFVSRLWKTTRSVAAQEASTTSVIGTTSSESQDKKNWQQQIEQVNANAQSSPSFVKVTQEVQPVLDEVGTSSERHENIDKEQAQSPKAGQFFFRNVRASLARGGNRKEEQVDDSPRAEASSVQKPKETEVGSSKTAPNVSMTGKGVTSLFSRNKKLPGMIQSDPGVKLSTTTKGAAPASLVHAGTSAKTTVSEASIPVPVQTISKQTNSATSTATDFGPFVLVLSLMVVLVAVLASMLVSLAPSTHIGDWLCGPVRPMRILGDVSTGSQSVVGEAPWFVPSSMKREAFIWVCGVNRTRTQVEWIGETEKHGILEIRNADSGKRLLMQKKIVHAAFYHERVVYSTETASKTWAAPWHLVPDK